MFTPLPADLADREQAFEAFFELDERAEFFDPRHTAAYRRADGIFALDPRPRVGHQLLEAEADFAGFAVELDHFHVDQVADFHHVAGLGAAAVGEFADVDQPVRPAEVDERAVVHHAADGRAAGLALLELFEQFALLLIALLLEDLPAADDQAAAALVDFLNHYLHTLADERAQILVELHVHLAGRHEGFEVADFYFQAALVHRLDGAFHDLAGVHRIPVGRADGRAFFVQLVDAFVLVQSLDHHLHRAADRRLGHKLVQRHHALVFTVQLHQHFVAGQVDAVDRARQQPAELGTAAGRRVGGHERIERDVGHGGIDCTIEFGVALGAELLFGLLGEGIG